MINITPTISLVELLWVLIGAVGLGAHISLLLKGIGDKRIAYVHHVAPYIMRVANTAIRRQSVYAGVQLVMIFLGVNSMRLPPNDAATSVTAWVSGALIIMGEILLIVNGLWDNHDANELMNEIGGRRVNDDH